MESCWEGEKGNEMHENTCVSKSLIADSLLCYHNLFLSIEQSEDKNRAFLNRKQSFISVLVLRSVDVSCDLYVEQDLIHLM